MPMIAEDKFSLVKYWEFKLEQIIFNYQFSDNTKILTRMLSRLKHNF